MPTSGTTAPQAFSCNFSSAGCCIAFKCKEEKGYIIKKNHSSIKIQLLANEEKPYDIIYKIYNGHRNPERRPSQLCK